MYVGGNLITGTRFQGHSGKKLIFRGLTIWSKGYIVTYTLDGVTASGGLTALDGDPYTSVLTAASSKQILPWSVVVTMGGTDITSTAYAASTNTISIAEVTGSVSITASAVTMDAAYIPLEYIESLNRKNSNTISTFLTNVENSAYYPNSNTKLEMDVLINLVDGNSLVWSTRTPTATPSASTPQFYFYSRITDSTHYSFAWGSARQASTNTKAGRIITGQRVLIVCDKGKFTYTNVEGNQRSQTLNGGTWEESSNYLRFFGYSTNDNNSNYAFYGKFFRATISEEGVVKRNYVPAKNASTGQCGIYDTVYGVFKGNDNWSEPS